MDDRPPPRQIDLEDRPKRGGFTSRGFNTERPRTFMRDREARAAADKANAPFARREPRLDAGASQQHHPCAGLEADLARSAERRVGKGCVRTDRTRWGQENEKKKKK